jgi:hypothetical protein
MMRRRIMKSKTVSSVALLKRCGQIEESWAGVQALWPPFLREFWLVRESGLGSNVPAGPIMTETTPLDRVGSRHAFEGVLAGRQLCAVMSAEPRTSGLDGVRIRLGASLPNRTALSAAGEINRNAKQNADRRLPPGGNAGCSRTR